jgi:Zn-dependent protease
MLASILTFFVFLFSTAAHEAAHAITARRFGDNTAADAGLATLDPTPHIRREPLGMLLLPLSMLLMSGSLIGWGSAPYSPFWAANNPRPKALMALAGPMANLTIGLLCYGLMWVGVLAGVFQFGFAEDGALVVANIDALSGLALFLSIGLWLNIFLCLFNLLPVPPLDGSSVITLFMPEKYAVMVEEARFNPNVQLISLFLVFYFGPRLIMPFFAAFMGLLF